MDTLDMSVSFKDLVAAQIARFIELKQDRLFGNENINYVLSEIRENLENGDWYNWIEVDQRNDVRSQNYM
jgi:hypothetical protein